MEVMSSGTWREAIAEQNARLGIKIRTPPTPDPLPPKKPVGHVDRMAEREELAGAIDSRRRHVANEMNGIEKKYAAYLETRRLCGEIAGWKFEGIKLKLARATFYNPDFLVVKNDGRLELHETKGHWEDDARVKTKVAAEMFPEFRFVVVTQIGKPKRWSFKNYKGQEEQE